MPVTAQASIETQDDAEVQQILDRFRCHHEGCGQKLDKLRNLDKSGHPGGGWCQFGTQASDGQNDCMRIIYSTRCFENKK